MRSGISSSEPTSSQDTACWRSVQAGEASRSRCVPTVKCAVLISEMIDGVRRSGSPTAPSTPSRFRSSRKYWQRRESRRPASRGASESGSWTTASTSQPLGRFAIMGSMPLTSSVCQRAGRANSTVWSLSRCLRPLGGCNTSSGSGARSRLTTGSKEFIAGYFSMLDWVLNAQGAACFQVITMPEARFERCA